MLLKTLILFTVLLGNICFVNAQNKIPKLKGDLNCVYKPKYSAKQRTQFYPFNIADTIKLVSFRYHRHNYPVKGDTLIVDSLIETKALSKAYVDTLTDILYNNFYKQSPNYGTLTQCNFPRNAVLFIDKSGKVKEYILLCFHCNRHDESSEQVQFGSECTQKIEKLRLFFIAVGLKFGTDRNINIYEGEGDDFIDFVAPPIND